MSTCILSTQKIFTVFFYREIVTGILFEVQRICALKHTKLLYLKLCIMRCTIARLHVRFFTCSGVAKHLKMSCFGDPEAATSVRYTKPFPAHLKGLQKQKVTKNIPAQSFSHGYTCDVCLTASCSATINMHDKMNGPQKVSGKTRENNAMRCIANEKKTVVATILIMSCRKFKQNVACVTAAERLSGCIFW